LSLLIVSGTDPETLDKFLKPLVSYVGVPVQVLSPGKVTSTPIADDTTTVLLMGSKAFGFLSDQIPKKQKLGSSRERLYKLGELSALVTYDLNLANFVPEIKPDIEWDVRLAVRHAVTGTIKPKVGNYHYVDNFDEVVEWATHLPTKDILTPMCLDLETLGLDEFSPEGRILTIQISYKQGHSVVYRVPPDGKLPTPVAGQLTYLLAVSWINTIGANLKYDMRWMAHQWKIWVLNHRFDTQLVGGLLDENRFNNLKGHIKAYAPELGGYEDTIEGTYNKARMDLALAADPAGFLQYAGGDTDGCLRIYTPMRYELLKDPQLALFYTRLLQPASVAFRQLETRGIVIDHPRYIELAAEAEKEMTQQSSECFAMMPNKIKYKYAANLKLTRPVIVKDFLFGPDGLNLKPTQFTEGSEKLIEKGLPPQPSTAWGHFKTFIDHPEAGPFVKKYKEHNVTAKALSTYIVGFLEHLRSDGRFHPSYILAKGGQGGDEDEEGGTNTGRSSCKDPAYQTWPKRTAWAKRLRSVVICPPGHVILKLDFSQGELRIMADASNCKVMIEAYLQGKDLHAITAAELMGISLVDFYKLTDEQQELQRYLAKACNFGLIYRISPEGLRAYAASSYGVVMTEKEAIQYHTNWFKPYPEVRVYHERQVLLARKQGWVRNQLGRVRHCPLIKSPDGKLRGQAERQAINAPTQGCLFDMMMLLMIQIHRVRPDIWLFGNTHDSLEMYVKEETWEQDAKQIKQLAEHLPLDDFGWSPKVPFTVDFEMSKTNMAEMKKVKIA
jgi:DNA polymerase I-like protein with 3'-5' exonuclease and polymerase domains